jgi:galactonate dehydratase
LESHEAELKTAMGEGFTAFKLGPGKFVEPFHDEKQVDVALELFTRMRQIAGPDIELMIDCGGIFSLQAAHRLTDGLRKLNLLFVEEPVNADTPRQMVELRRAFTGVHIAAGERVMTRWGFREWLEQGGVDVIQADISHCGGIGELLRIGACAEVYNVQIAPHNPYGPVAMAASLHACAAMPNFLILEHCRLRPWFNEVQKSGPRLQAGCVHLTSAPGLGVELDWEYVARHPFRPLNTWQLTDLDGGMPLV